MINQRWNNVGVDGENINETILANEDIDNYSILNFYFF